SGDFTGEVLPFHARLLTNDCKLLVCTDFEVISREDSRTHCSFSTDAQRYRAGVNPADTDNAVGDEVLVKRTLSTEVRDASRWVTNYEACRPHFTRLHVLVVYPGIA